MNIRAPSCTLAIIEIQSWAEAEGLRFEHNALTGSGAVFSNDLAFRYLIWRCWSVFGQFHAFGMLNPSTAGADSDDATSTRCTNRSMALRAGGWIGWNLFAVCATDPKVMKRTVDPVGPLNNDAISLALSLSRQCIAGWGTDGGHQGRDTYVKRMLGAAGVKIDVLGLTKEGHPRHPLYIPAAVQPQPWDFLP